MTTAHAVKTKTKCAKRRTIVLAGGGMTQPGHWFSCQPCNQVDDQPCVQASVTDRICLAASGNSIGANMDAE